jgi:hypothetical protein
MRCFRAWIPAILVVLSAPATNAAVHHQHKQTEGEIRRHAWSERLAILTEFRTGEEVAPRTLLPFRPDHPRPLSIP